MNTRIIIFDNDEHSRNATVSLIRSDVCFELVGLHAETRHCVRNISQSSADIAIIGLARPQTRGIEAIRQIKTRIPHVQILIQTAFENEHFIHNAILAGASGYLLKEDVKEALVYALNEIRRGCCPISPSIARKVFDILRQAHTDRAETLTDYKLTQREKEVLTCLVKGSSYKMICVDLNIKYDTVRTHVKKIYEKLRVTSLTEAVAKAINQTVV